MNRNVRIHGTYPFDDERGRWKMIRNLTPREAATMTAMPDPDQYPDHNAGTSGSCWDNPYLWLNKGYIIIGPDAPNPGEADIKLAFMEMLGGSPEVKGIKPGCQAVYLHDGCYSLIERVK